MNNHARRLRALEGNNQFLTIGELLDSLDGEPLPMGKVLSPLMRQWFGSKEEQRHA